MNLVGERLGRLLVLRLATPIGIDQRWFCRCDCGREVAIRQYSLRRKSSPTRSCGCLSVVVNTRHGHAGKGRESRTYRTWKAMHNRCYDPKHPAFETYSVLGVTKPWRDSFLAFLQDMGERPDGRTLDRIDNRFGYFLANCRWATPKEQANNRRTSVELTHGERERVGDSGAGAVRDTTDSGAACGH